MEGLNPQIIREMYSPFFTPKQKTIISPDLDGLLSGWFLTVTLDWEIIGIYTMENLWIKCFKGRTIKETIKNTVFVDHDINSTSVYSVGHHILCWSNEIGCGAHCPSSSLNPNLLRKRDFKSFSKKYPFGRIHFILSLSTEIPYARELIEALYHNDMFMALLLHVDSSFINAINYQKNALDWINWLGGSEEPSPLAPFCKILLKWHPYRTLIKFKELASFFEEIGLKPRKQAVFIDPTDKHQTLPIQELWYWLNDISNVSVSFPFTHNTELQKLSITRKSVKPTKKNFLKYIVDCHTPPFSYALISKAYQGLNLAYISDFP